jgi:peptide deformylase
MSKIIKYIDGQLVEYEIYKLVDSYDPILKQPCKELSFTDSSVKPGYIARSLAETLSKLEGLGLAANQCGIPYRVIAINAGTEIWTLINPKITWKSDAVSDYSEGCLSFPGLYLKVKRPNSIKVEFQDMAGNKVEQTFDGLSATVIQHEVDHLDGICFTDKISPIKLEQAKRKIKTNLKKMKRAVTRGVA